MPETLKKQGIKPSTYENLLRWGWVDSAGRSLDWMFWNRR